jgi:hypothetical protein
VYGPLSTFLTHTILLSISITLCEWWCEQQSNWKFRYIFLKKVVEIIMKILILYKIFLILSDKTCLFLIILTKQYIEISNFFQVVTCHVVVTCHDISNCYHFFYFQIGHFYTKVKKHTERNIFPITRSKNEFPPFGH